jgi:chorismate mutase
MLYRCGANILTINQNIPIGGLAPVSVTARIDGLNIALDTLLSGLRGIDGVEEISVMLGD